jgi:hypothetical protein
LSKRSHGDRADIPHDIETVLRETSLGFGDDNPWERSGRCECLADRVDEFMRLNAAKAAFPEARFKHPPPGRR